MRKLILCSLLLTALFSGGCAMVKSPVTGFLYTNVQSSTNATSNKLGRKTGMSCAKSILGLFAWGNASISRAQRSARITKISSVDSKGTSILGIYAKYCTVVRGS